MCSLPLYETFLDRAIISVDGLEAKEFLNKIVTNVMPSENQINYSFILTPNGRYLLDFFIINYKNELLIDIGEISKLDLMDKLNLYKLNSNVCINDVSELYDIAYVNNEFHLNSNSTAILLSRKDPRFQKLGYRCLVKKNTFKNTNSLKSLYKRDKYIFTIPDEIDFISGRSIPLEYGMYELNAFDFNKGCYIGQETISRIHNQGVIRKKIFKLTNKNKVDFPILGKYASIETQNGVIGHWCSSYQNYAIVLLNCEKVENYSEISILVEGKNFNVNLTIPDWRNP